MSVFCVGNTGKMKFQLTDYIRTQLVPWFREEQFK
jgi:hypothetical protein